jgi:hypothetical protein
MWAALLTPGTVTDSTPSNSPPIRVDQPVFKPGEKMVFRVAYTWSAFWLNAGEISFKLAETDLNGGPTLHVRVDGETYKSYEWFYKVKDRYETYMHQESLLPQLFIRDANEGGFIIKEDYTFNHGETKVYTKDYRHEPVKQDTFQTVPRVHDVVSAIYYARTIDYSKYKAGDKIPIDIFIDGKTYSIHITFLGRDRIKTKAGKFDVLIIRPSLIDNDLFEADDEMTIYVTDDKNKIPVRVESPLTVGWVKADLIGYGGLAHPFEAKVD